MTCRPAHPALAFIDAPEIDPRDELELALEELDRRGAYLALRSPDDIAEAIGSLEEETFEPDHVLTDEEFEAYMVAMGFADAKVAA
jgi:hypothetical protein